MNDQDYGRLRGYLDGELDDPEYARIVDELEDSPELSEALDEVRELGVEVDAALSVSQEDLDIEEALRRVQGTEAPSGRAKVIPLVVTAIAAAAACLLLVLWPLGGRDVTGSIAADGRQTVALAERGIAVAEDGAALSWTVAANGHARVRQTAGAVFYRVESGEAFIVDTPAGSVSVTGTCFTVELRPMKRSHANITSAAAGAVLATGIFLTVHEGSVVLANDRGQVDVAAGDRAVARSGSSPELVGTPAEADASQPPKQFKALMQENSQQRARLRELQRKLDVEASPTAPDAAPEVDTESPEYRRELARQCAKSGGCDFRIWTDPTREDLVELARCDRLLVDSPSFLWGSEDGIYPPGDIIEAAGLSEDDADLYAQTATDYYQRSEERLRGLAKELGLSDRLADRLQGGQLRGVVDSLVRGSKYGEVREQVARERAGLESTPLREDQSTEEQALRFIWGQGSEFEGLLADEFGEDAAHEMRRAHGGWGSKSSLGGGKCSD